MYSQGSPSVGLSASDPNLPHIESLSVGPAHRKKRAARAFHGDFASPGPAPPVFSTPQSGHSSQFTTPQIAPQTFFPLPSAHPHQPISVSSPGHSLAPDLALGLFSNAGSKSSLSSLNVPQSPVGSSDVPTSLPDFRYVSQQQYITPSDEDGMDFKSFHTFENVLPPEATNQFHTLDQGTASSKFIRSSMYYVPESELLRLDTKMPLSITVRPFAPLLPTEEPIPVVDMTRPDVKSDDPLDMGPIRCRRCRAYINPLMQFKSSRHFTCNICQYPRNIVPDDYVTVLDAHDQRADKFVRPELHKGVYDLLVPAEYNFGGADVPPTPINHLFLIDISETSVKQNLPVLAADAIRSALYNQPADAEPSRAKYGIMAFDKRLHFFNLAASLETAQVVISGELDDPFVPFSEGLFVDPQESKLAIFDALSHLEALCQQKIFADSEPCFSLACRTAMMCVKLAGGGKVTSLLSSLPSWGPGSLKYKDNKLIGRAPAPELEARVFGADSDYYKLLAKDFMGAGVGLDVHAVSPAAVDMSNVGWLASRTGGSVSRWPNFEFERDGRALVAKIASSTHNARGFQGHLKMRCSNGLQVAHYYGAPDSAADNKSHSEDPALPIVDCNQTFTILMLYDGKLSSKLDCHFQAALLYTDPEGIRKVRVINLVLAVCERLEDVFNFADENAIATTIIREQLSHFGKQSIALLREAVNLKLVDIFAQYRIMSELGHRRNGTGSKHVVFPESLKHLPYYVLGFLKSKAMCAVSGVPADARLVSVYQMLHMPIETLMYQLYPSVIELHSMYDDEAIVERVHGFINLPIQKCATIKQFQPAAYIMCNGTKIFVWVDPSANLLMVRDLFGEGHQSVADLNPFVDEIPELDSAISAQARNIVRHFNERILGVPYLGSAGIQIVRPGIDGSMLEFKESMVEDAFHGTIEASAGPNYADYVASLSGAVRVKSESNNTLKSLKK